MPLLVPLPSTGPVLPVLVPPSVAVTAMVPAVVSHSLPWQPVWLTELVASVVPVTLVVGGSPLELPSVPGPESVAVAVLVALADAEPLPSSPQASDRHERTDAPTRQLRKDRFTRPCYRIAATGAHAPATRRTIHSAHNRPHIIDMARGFHYRRRMRLTCLLSPLLALACAHSVEKSPGPRPLGMNASLARNDATLDLRFHYEVAPDRTLTLLVDLAAAGSGSVGPVRVDVRAENLELVGDPGWSGELVAGNRATHRFVLRPQANGVGHVTVEYGLVDAAIREQVALKFLISAEQVRPCQAADEACKAP